MLSSLSPHHPTPQVPAQSQVHSSCLLKTCLIGSGETQAREQHGVISHLGVGVNSGVRKGGISIPLWMLTSGRMVLWVGREDASCRQMRDSV